MKTILQEIIEELVSESLRSFNFPKFVAISTASPGFFEKENEYARKNLPAIGEGSARAVFALSGGKVLKIARNIKGIAQNQAEIEIWNKTKSPLITQIFNAATDFKWVVAEVVKEMKLREFLNSLNLPINFDFDEILLLKPSSLESIIKHLENKIQTCEDKILNLEENLRATQLQRNPDQNTIKSFEKDIQRNKENVVEIHQVLKNKHFLEFCENIIKLVNTQSLVWGELHYKHFGRNVQGKVKLFDYGYTESVSKQYYGKR